MPDALTQYHSSRVNLESLSPEHYIALEQSVSTILSTTLATETLAQVVDGIPTRDVYREYYGYRRKDFDDNICPSHPALQAVESYRQNVNIGSLQVDAKVRVCSSLSNTSRVLPLH